MATLTQCTDPTKKAEIVESVRPDIHDFHHQDSVFGNSFQPKSHYIVHPDWVSEGVNPPVSTPLNRAPWSWEQPRHRQNVQYPITYDTPRYSKEEKQGPTLPYRPPRMVGFHPPQGYVEGPEMTQGYVDGLEGQSGVHLRDNTDIPECFRQNGMNEPTLQYQPMNTMEERERIHWHLHY